MTVEQQPHPAAVAYLDSLPADGWTVSIEPRDWVGMPSWVVTVAKDDARTVTTATSRAIAVEQAAWHHGARWD